MEIARGGDRQGRRKKRRELTDEQRQEIQEAFNLFDNDKDGAIDYHELKVNLENNTVVNCHVTASSPRWLFERWDSRRRRRMCSEYSKTTTNRIRGKSLNRILLKSVSA